MRGLRFSLFLPRVTCASGIGISPTVALVVAGALRLHSSTVQMADVFPMSLESLADSMHRGAQQLGTHQWRPEARRLQDFLMSGRPVSIDSRVLLSRESLAPKRGLRGNLAIDWYASCERTCPHPPVAEPNGLLTVLGNPGPLSHAQGGESTGVEVRRPGLGLFRQGRSLWRRPQQANAGASNCRLPSAGVTCVGLAVAEQRLLFQTVALRGVSI